MTQTSTLVADPESGLISENPGLPLETNGASARVFRDPAFTANREVPVHRWVPWIAGFSASFVSDCLDNFLPTKRRSCRVLDPFAGVGTTIVAALQRGHDAVGFEINPYATLTCRAKIAALHIDISSLDRAIQDYEYASRNGSRISNGTPPVGFSSRIPFFSTRVEKQVYGFFAFLRNLEQSAVADFFKVAFGSVMVSFSNYTSEPSLSTRPGAGKPLIHDANVHAAVLSKLRKMRADTELLQASSRAKRDVKAHVHCMSFMESPSVLRAASIDLAVTSPPYLNNYHYIRSTRPHLYWLDLLGGDRSLKNLEHENLGKYWQTVRAQSRINLGFSDGNLERLLDSIRRTRRDKGVYGGAGWANYVASYFNDSAKFLAKLSRSLRPNGYAVIVVGNSIIQGHEIRVDEVLGSMAAEAGLSLEAIEVLRSKRVGASITQSNVRRGEKSRASLYESAVILRRERT